MVDKPKLQCGPHFFLCRRWRGGETSAGAGAVEKRFWATTWSLFARLISHQPAVLFSQNKPATSRNQPAVLFSQNKPASAISHQPTEQAHGLTPLHSRSRETLSCKEGAPLFN
jgi:hypothetical protein